MRLILITQILFFSINISLLAQNAAQEKEEFWFCPSAEIALYSEHSFSYGAGFVFAYGKKASFGFKGSFFFDEAKELDVLELHILFRLYLLNGNTGNSPFFQLTAGPAIFNPRKHDVTLPAKIGMFSAGLCFGWRFSLGKTFFIEPQIRGGYPFAAGSSLSAGFRF